MIQWPHTHTVSMPEHKIFNVIKCTCLIFTAVACNVIAENTKNINDILQFRMMNHGQTAPSSRTSSPTSRSPSAQADPWT